jgi:hypothetical protein
MLKLLGIFTSGTGPFILVGFLILASSSASVWVTHKVDSATLEHFKSAQATQAATDNAKALEQLQAHDAAAARTISDMGAAQEQRVAQLQSIRKAIANAPKSRACVDSPAIRSLFDGLRAGSNQRH